MNTYRYDHGGCSSMGTEFVSSGSKGAFLPVVWFCGHFCKLCLKLTYFYFNKTIILIILLVSGGKLLNLDCYHDYPRLMLGALKKTFLYWMIITWKYGKNFILHFITFSVQVCVCLTEELPSGKTTPNYDNSVASPSVWLLPWLPAANRETISFLKYSLNMDICNDQHWKEIIYRECTYYSPIL